MPSEKETKSTKPQYSHLVPAVEQACRLLLTLARHESGGLTLTEICNIVGIHKSKGYSILNTLQHFAFVQRDPRTKIYSLGPGLLFPAGKVLANLDLREIAAPVLRKLSYQTNSTAFLVVISDGHVFVVAKDEGNQDIGVSIRLGHRFPLAWGAHGKAIVAFLPERERERILGSDKLYVHGDPWAFDRERLMRELEACRETGFATDLGEMNRGIHAVASPVSGPGGQLMGALVVVGTFSKDMANGHGAEVASAAGSLSQLLQGAAGL